MTIENNKILRKRIMNIVFFLAFSILTISAYYFADFSKAKDMLEIKVNVSDFLEEGHESICFLNATKDDEKNDFFINLPEYIEDKKVIKYEYNIEPIIEIIEDNTTNDSNVEVLNEIVENEVVEEIIDINEVANEIKEANSEIINNIEEEKNEEIETKEDTETYILPFEKLYLSAEEVENKTLSISAIYDTKEKDGITLYKQILTKQVNDCWATVLGYMPLSAELEINEIEKQNVEEQIKQKTEKDITLAVAYDIKIVNDEKSYEPYEFDENIEVTLELEKNKEEQDNINIWHIKENGEVELLDSKEVEEQTKFTTDSFSVYGIEALDEEVSENGLDIINESNIEDDVEIMQQQPVMLLAAAAGVTDSVFVVDDEDSDLYYWQGKNYTDDVSGVYSGDYEDFATVTINYYGYKNGETDPNMIGWVSLTERYNVFEYHKTFPVQSGKISIELIDNPFMDKPTGYGFGGWTCGTGTITTDSLTKVQTLTLNATANSNISINVYTNWVQATVVYVNQETGFDDTNSGLTPDSPFGSWGAAFNYINNHSSDRNDREKNIIVLTGDIDTSFNYTQPITTRTIEREYQSSTTFTSGNAYMLSDGTGTGGHVLTVGTNGTSITNTTLQDNTTITDNMLWTITVTGSNYVIRNVGTGKYLTGASNTLALANNSANWTYSTTNRRFRYGTNGRYLRYNSTWQASTSGTTLYFLQLIEYDEPETERVVGTRGNNTYYTSNTSSAVTITSLYNHTDYRTNAVMDLTNGSYQDWTIYKDFQIDFVDVNATGYTLNGDGTATSGNYPILFGNAHNIRIGRGMYPSNTANAACTMEVIHRRSNWYYIFWKYNRW